MANALRSMPAQNPRPAPVSTPAVSPSSESSCSTAREQPLGEVGVDGVHRLGAVERDQQHPPPGLGEHGFRRLTWRPTYAQPVLLRPNRPSHDRTSGTVGIASTRCSPGSSRSWAASPSATAIALRIALRDRARRRRARGLDRRQRLLPHRRRLRRGDDWWEAELTDETWSRTSLGDLAPGDARQPRAAGAAVRPPRRAPRAGSRRRRRRDRRAGARPARALRAGPAALRRREGLDHRRRDQPHRRRRRSTTASPSPSSRTPPT